MGRVATVGLAVGHNSDHLNTVAGKTRMRVSIERPLCEIEVDYIVIVVRGGYQVLLQMSWDLPDRIRGI